MIRLRSMPDRHTTYNRCSVSPDPFYGFSPDPDMDIWIWGRLWHAISAPLAEQLPANDRE